MHLPANRTLEAFVATARLGSLAAAGASVGMSVPALSRRLAALEKALGVRLLERMPRGVVQPLPAKRTSPTLLLFSTDYRPRRPSYAETLPKCA